jgi:hypothetical protein
MAIRTWNSWVQAEREIEVASKSERNVWSSIISQCAAKRLQR